MHKIPIRKQIFYLTAPNQQIAKSTKQTAWTYCFMHCKAQR